MVLEKICFTPHIEKILITLYSTLQIRIMPTQRLFTQLNADLDQMQAQGRRKGAENVICAVQPAQAGRGPRYLLEGCGDQLFIKMNSNNYLGLSLHPKVMAAEEAAVHAYGVGPGAVRFISGTYTPHVALEQRLAAFHGREACMLFSSAYATIVSTIVPLITPDTALISDELNHNCIINAMRLARPAEKHIYKHLNLAELETALQAASRACKRAVIVTDGIFSMRGVHAPLAAIAELVHRYDSHFAENAILVVDDSHGVGAFGVTGRGTEEFTQTHADILVGTLGKAFGVNGGYVTGSRMLTDYLRETAPMYIYSNPISPAEAAAALASLDIVDSTEGVALLAHLRAVIHQFRAGLARLGHETLPGEHSVVPLMVRDNTRTLALVQFLRTHGILATGIRFPVVPKGDESIRFQIAADHTTEDIDMVLNILAKWHS